MIPQTIRIMPEKKLYIINDYIHNVKKHSRIMSKSVFSCHICFHEILATIRITYPKMAVTMMCKEFFSRINLASCLLNTIWILVVLNWNLQDANVNHCS